MDERAERLFNVLRETARERPLAFVAAAVAVFVVVFFWHPILLLLRGLLFAAIALVLIFGTILLWVKVKYAGPGYKALVSEKKTLLNAIKIAEGRYMKRKLSREDFNRIFKEKQARLIEVEASLNEMSARAEKPGLNKALLEVQTKKRHVLKALLEKKRHLLEEMGIAEKRYLKRKIDSATYQGIVQKNQKALVEVEAEIKQLQSEASVSRVMDNLKKGLSETGESKSKKERKKKREKREQEVKIAREIAEQVAER